MAELKWTEPALQDLDVIADYIALDKPEAARAFVKEVFAKVEALQKFPKLGSIPREIKDLPYRQLVIAPCRIFYKQEGSKVFILYVMRGEMLFHPNVLNERDKKR